MGADDLILTFAMQPIRLPGWSDEQWESIEKYYKNLLEKEMLKNA